MNRSLDPLRIPTRRLPSTAPLHGSLRAHSARPQLLSSPSPSWGSLKSEHIQEDSSHKRKNTASKERQKRWAAPTMERVGALVSTRARAARRAIIQALPSTLPLCSDIQLFRHSLQLSNSDTLPTEPTSSPPAGPTKPGPGPLEEALSDGGPILRCGLRETHTEDGADDHSLPSITRLPVPFQRSGARVETTLQRRNALRVFLRTWYLSLSLSLSL